AYEAALESKRLRESRYRTGVFGTHPYLRSLNGRYTDERRGRSWSRAAVNETFLSQGVRHKISQQHCDFRHIDPNAAASPQGWPLEVYPTGCLPRRCRDNISPSDRDWRSYEAFLPVQDIR